MLSLLGSLRGGSSFITNSLRFRSSASAYLSKTFAANPITRTQQTFSFWTKRGSLGSTQILFSGYDGSSIGAFIFNFTSSDTLQFFYGGSAANNIITTQVFRDPSAWYHIVASIDSTQPTPSNRVKIYLNGLQITAFGTTNYPPQNTLMQFALNNGNNKICNNWDNTSNPPFDGYLTEVNFIDGQALTPASFGAIDSSTGVWAPRPYSGTYGTNGFYLKFANTSSVAALGTDSSGNGNTWTVNNVSLTAGATYDSMIDVPVNYADGGNGRGNYAVLNPLRNVFGIISDAGLNYVVGSSANKVFGTIGISSGKWYWECSYTAGTTGSLGIATNDSPSTSHVGVDAFSWGYLNTAQKLNSNVFASYGATYTAGDIIGVAFDADLGSLTFYKNNVSQGVAYSGLASNIYFPVFGDQNASASSTLWVNFGQRPFNTANGLPPAGFRALNTNNLPTPSIVNGANFMAATTYTGTAGVQSIPNAVNSVSFQPDLVWIKSRTPGATNHALFDSTRGTGKYLSSDTTAAETTNANTLTAFNGGGFSLGTDTTLVNANANSYIAWQWRESITAGLDVVSYAGTGVNRTVAHNLGVAPAMVIVKRSQTGATSNWQVRHTSIPVANSIQLNSTNQATADTTVWNSTAPTSSVFSLGTSTDVNASGISYVAYCFAEIAGFSRFGSYTGNGLADGPFVFCGFRPRWVMIRKTSASGNFWTIRDTTRNTFNVANLQLYPNSAVVEGAPSAGDVIDIVSNGFKLRGISADVNDPSATYIFAAFAEVPSKYALAR